jgi:endonuclease III-like uncharacterized protein
MWSKLGAKLNEQQHCTLKQLTKIIEWKMLRGLFRPRNTQLVASNDPEEVENLSKQAFQLASSQPTKAIALLGKLKGIGPASASAILACYLPRIIPFMSDECMTAVGLPLKYTQKSYVEFYSLINEKLEHLPGWNANDIQQALWSKYNHEKLSEQTVQVKKLVGTKRAVPQKKPAAKKLKK